MLELITLLAIYYQCAALAEDGLLTQQERFECNATYQEAKRLFLEDDLPENTTKLSAQQNRTAYLRLKEWEAENGDLIQNWRTQKRLRIPTIDL